jgi:hypothetical protein
MSGGSVPEKRRWGPVFLPVAIVPMMMPVPVCQRIWKDCDSFVQIEIAFVQIAIAFVQIAIAAWI